MLYYIFLRVLFMSLAMTAGGILVLAADKLFLRFFSYKLRRCLWLIVLIPGLVPVTGLVSLPQIPAVEDAVPAYVQTDTVKTDRTTANSTSDDTVGSNAAEAGTGGITQQNIDAQPMNTAVSNRGIDHKWILPALYAAGLLTAAVIYAARAVRFGRMLKHASLPCRCELAGECQRITGVKREIGFLAVNADCSPFVYGIMRPRIVLSNGDISHEALLHELMHIKHHDTTYLLLLHIVTLVHFFNPFVYLLGNQIRKHMEFACDEETAALLDKKQRLAYSKSILECASPLSTSAACLSENGKNVKERIDIIMTNKNYTKLRSFAGFLLSAVMVTCMGIAAGAINDRAPVRSYAINTARQVYGLSYNDGSKHWYSGRTGHEANRASLVNTAVYKGFAADIGAIFKSEPDDESVSAQFEADVHIEMDRFIGEIENGKTWQGLFTVTFGDEVILSEARGWLNDIPGEGARDFTRLYIESDDGNVYFDLFPIDFTYTEDSKINAESEEWQLENFSATDERHIYVTSEASYETNGRVITETKEEYPVDIRANRNTGQFVCSIPLVDGRYISTIPGNTYTFNGSNVSGTFFLNESGAIRLEEIEGTLSGFDSDTISFRSNDGTIKVNMYYASDNADSNQLIMSYGTNDDPFVAGCTGANYRRQLADLPFTLSLTEDKTHVRLSFKDDFAPDLYAYSYASYSSENSVYNKGNSDAGFDDIYLDISPTYSTHNLQFFAYYIYPHTKTSFYDVSFRILNDELVYWGCSEYVTENTAYSGEEGLNEMWEHMIKLWD